MATVIDWVAGCDGEGSGGQVLRLKAGKEYRVRLVGKAIRYLQHQRPIVCRSPGVDPLTGLVRDPLMQMGFEPKPIYAIWVLDREDGNRLKVMDFPCSLFDAFSEWMQFKNEDPGGVNGCDWEVKVQAKVNTRRKMKKSSAKALEKSKFSRREAKRIKDLGDLSKKLLEARREHTPQEIRTLLAMKSAEEISY